MGRNSLSAGATKRHSVRSTITANILLATVSTAVVLLWVQIGQSHNTFYIAAGVCATILSLGGLIVYYFRRLRRGHIAHHTEEGGADALGQLDPAVSMKQRALLREFYGENVDYLLAGGPGLTTRILDLVVPRTAFKQDKNETSGVPALDIEQGARASPLVKATDCAICATSFQDEQSVMGLPCGHSFHPTCLTPRLLEHNRCPHCQKLAVRLDALTAAMLDASAELSESSVTPSASAPARGPVRTLSQALDSCKVTTAAHRTVAPEMGSARSMYWSSWSPLGLFRGRGSLTPSFTAVAPVMPMRAGTDSAASNYRDTVAAVTCTRTVRPFGAPRTSSTTSVNTTLSHCDRDTTPPPSAW